MITRSQLEGLDVLAFDPLLQQIRMSIQSNKDKISDIEKATSHIVSGWEGESSNAAQSRLSHIQEQTQKHIDDLEAMKKTVTTYVEAKKLRQAHILAFIAELKTLQMTVTDDWQVRPNIALMAAASVGGAFILAAQVTKRLHALVRMFEQYEYEAPIAGVSTAPSFVSSSGYSTSQPDRTINFDDDFPYGSKKGKETLEDRANWAKWGLKLEGAEAIGGMPDACKMYRHFREGKGTPMRFDYDKAYREDAGIRNFVNDELNGSLQAANEAVKSGNTNVTLHSPMRTNSGYYPETENWQKTVGGYSSYTETNVQVSGDTVTATVTVHAKDKWNFNRGYHDAKTGTPDDVNGRFEELGWAKGFETSGSMTRTYTWKVGEQPPNLSTNTTENTTRS